MTKIQNNGRNNKVIEDISNEILMIEELILACILKNKNEIKDTIKVLSYISTNSFF